MTHLDTIEKVLSKSFIATIGDYQKQLLYNEEDFRASYYHHLRQRIKKYPDLKVHLSYTFEGKKGIAKPDIMVFRKNKPLIVMEFKIAPYSKASGIKDIDRLKYWSQYISKGYFVHIDRSERKYNQRIANWKNHFYKELAYYTQTEKGFLFEVKYGQKSIDQIIK